MDYSNYQTEDFILDESFQDWVRGSDRIANDFWKAWVDRNPHKKESVERAREILLNLAFWEKPVADEEIRKEWLQLKAELQRDEAKERSIPHFTFWQKIAASVILIIFAGLSYYIYNQSQIIAYSTNYGETRKVLLPDSSIVTLNGNSSIAFKKNWSGEKERVVSLLGEAFFSVTHKANDQKFIVKAEDLKVIVLGTQFNVNSRRGNVKVVLNSGKVELSDNHKNKVEMKPGEMVQYSLKNEKYLKKKVRPELYSSWKNNRLEFKNTPIHEIAQLLEDNYGLSVIIQDKSIGNRNLTGSYPANDIDILIKAMSGIFQINITQNGNRLILENKK